MEEYLRSGTLPKNEFAELVKLEALHFRIDDRLVRRIAEGITAPYLEWEFRGDLIQRMHAEYRHLSLAGMRDLVQKRAWWPKPKISMNLPRTEESIAEFVEQEV
jgi:hypothetical protein